MELFRLAARTSAVLGYMAVNTGRHLVAEAYCAEAVELARDITDVETTMWAMGTRSLNSYYQGDYAASAMWADTGLRLAPEHPQAIRLLINGRARPLGGSGTAPAQFGRSARQRTSLRATPFLAA
ncbi:hypothetical protein [Streptomyces sp. C8S0]|uniref:hypothetical protein n=1 Tax=Streptomyces sp. C8S0 TaxID=2585716 RepID=UPI00125D5566|nr:hypothetical protein [Streptomyces sp. C8S0]